jgi:dihydroflavonol-4-reductase
MSVTVLVTGAAGHIGGTLVRALLARGRRARALVHRDRRALQGLETEIVEGDVLDPTSLHRAIEGAEVVYHTAAYISLSMREWPRLEAVNVIGTRNVVEASLRCGVRRLIHFSSIEALGQDPLGAPIDEARPLLESPSAPPYSRSKAAAQRAVENGIARGLDALILIPAGIVGPYDFRPSHLGEGLLALAQGQLPALVEGGFNWVDVRDVAEAAIRAEERAVAGATYLLSGHRVSLREMAVMVEAITGTPAPRFVCPMWLARIGLPFITAAARLNGKRPLCTRASLTALRGNPRISHQAATRDLGYQPRPFEETLSDTLKWFEEAGYVVHSPGPGRRGAR